MLNQDRLPGQQIDQFQVLKHIGRGGMADVYLAEDKDLNRRVVLKLMLPEVALNEQLVARFQREAQTTARLAHPHIVQIYTIGQTPEGQPYLALQYISGGSLADYVQGLRRLDQWISPTDALAIAAQMADALARAHAAGIVHRDLKPSNILLRDDGTAVLSDLGIAAVQQASTRLTRTGSVLGTPHYMSPEQALGKPVDGRSDLYSLGVILYELLAKRPPFDADSPLAVVHQHVYEQPMSLEQIRPGLTTDTYELVHKSLQKDPASRYQTAGEMAAAIERALYWESEVDPAGLTVIDTLAPSTPLIPPQYPEVPEKKKKFSILLIALGAAILVTFFVGIGYAANHFLNPEDVVVVPTSTATPPITPTGIQGIDPSLSVIPSMAPDEPLSSSLQPTATVTAFAEAPYTPTATASPTPELVGQAPLPGDGLVQMTSASSSEFAPVLSPDQRTVVFFSDQSGTWQIYTMDAQGGAWQQLTHNNVDNYHPHFSPDGKQIVFASQVDGNWEIYTMSTTGQQVQRITYNDTVDEYPSFSPDGEWIIFLSKRDQGWGVYAMRADGSEERVIIDTAANETYPVSSPDGQRVVFQSDQTGNHDIFTIPWTGGAPRQITTSSARDANPVYSPDGRWIVFESDRNGNYEVYAIRADGTGERNLTDHTAQDQLPSFSADGEWLLFQSDRKGSVDIFRQPFNS